MSDYHIMAADLRGNAFSIVMHFPVPDTTNDADVNHRTAIVEYQGGAPIHSVLPNPGTEQAQLDAGELYERAYRFHSNPGEDLTTKRGRLDAMFTSKNAEVQAELSFVLSYWGYSRDVS